MLIFKAIAVAWRRYVLGHSLPAQGIEPKAEPRTTMAENKPPRKEHK